MASIFFDYELGEYDENAEEIKSRLFRGQCVEDHRKRKEALKSWATPLSKDWD